MFCLEVQNGDLQTTDPVITVQAVSSAAQRPGGNICGPLDDVIVCEGKPTIATEKSRRLAYRVAIRVQRVQL
jgi:hypothetical protein